MCPQATWDLLTMCRTIFIQRSYIWMTQNWEENVSVLQRFPTSRCNMLPPLLWVVYSWKRSVQSHSLILVITLNGMKASEKRARSRKNKNRNALLLFTAVCLSCNVSYFKMTICHSIITIYVWCSVVWHMQHNAHLHWVQTQTKT